MAVPCTRFGRSVMDLCGSPQTERVVNKLNSLTGPWMLTCDSIFWLCFWLHAWVASPRNSRLLLEYSIDTVHYAVTQGLKIRSISDEAFDEATKHY